MFNLISTLRGGAAALGRGVRAITGANAASAPQHQLHVRRYRSRGPFARGSATLDPEEGGGMPIGAGSVRGIGTSPTYSRAGSQSFDRPSNGLASDSTLDRYARAEGEDWFRGASRTPGEAP